MVKEGLVPVIIANDGTVTKTETDDINWYDYNESKWANAVLLTGTDIYQVGDTIPEEAIESYFVWIPKYRYKLFNVEGNNIPEQEIEIEIGDYNTKDTDTECIAPNISGDIGNCKNLNDEKGNGKWMTHPAFTSLGVNGIWVGKFETGYKGTTTDYNVIAPEKVQIKPNISSWRNINVSNMYNTSFNYKRNLDSHMMKNTEWGAMSFLTNSKYGRPKDENGVPTEVWTNNSSTYTTGCSASSASASQYNGCENTWNKLSGFHASTTDNISGIYDISGSAWDNMMAVYNNIAVESWLTSTNIPDKYIDRYTGENVNYKILGDATGETNGWNGDNLHFVEIGLPWFGRGGRSGEGILTGLFSFGHFIEDTHDVVGFRIVLSPSN